VQVAKSAPLWGDYTVTTPLQSAENGSAPQWRRIRAGTGICPWPRMPMGGAAAASSPISAT
jgi:hypothetical protein